MDREFLNGLIKRLKALQTAKRKKNGEAIENARQEVERYVEPLEPFADSLRTFQSKHGCHSDYTHQAIQWISNAAREVGHRHAGLWDALADKRFIAELERWEQTLEKGTEPKETKKKWSKPMSKSTIVTALNLDSTYKLNEFEKAGIYTMKKVGDNRQSWQIRIDKLPKDVQKKLI